jgi:ferredoxin
VAGFALGFIRRRVVNRLLYLKDVATLRLDGGKCTGCGVCVTVCPHGVLVISDGRATVADRDACMECGACAMNCAAEAISVQSGVGCAAAVINSLLGRDSSSCCCTIDPVKTRTSLGDADRKSPGCC